MPDVQPFFDRYMAAYRVGHADAFQAFFELPSLIVDSGGSHVIADDASLQAYMRPLVDALASHELQAVDYVTEHAEAVNDSECFCTNRYRILGSGDRLLGGMTYHYYLRPGGDDWRIIFARLGALRDWRL